MDRHANRSRAIGDQLQSRAWRQQRLQLSEGFVQPVNHAEGVFILRFLHRQQQRALAVVKRQTLQLLRSVSDSSHLVYRDRCATCVAAGRTPRGLRFARHNDLAEVFRPFHAGVYFDDAFLRQRADGADRQILVLAAHRIDHLVGRDTVRLHGLRIEVDVDFAAGSPHQRHRARAANVFQALSEYLIGPVGQLDG